MLLLLKDIFVWQFWILLFSIAPIIFGLPLLKLNKNLSKEKILRIFDIGPLSIVLVVILSVLSGFIFGQGSILSLSAFFISVGSSYYLSRFLFPMSGDQSYALFVKRGVLSFVRNKYSWIVVALIV